MKKTFLEKLASKKLVGKHVVLSNTYNFNNPVGWGTFSGVVKNIKIHASSDGLIDVAILLEGFDAEFRIQDSEFKEKVKITKQ